MIDRRCAHHADRPGHAVCMSCRKVVCEECATEWDGINYCVACLRLRRRREGRRASLPGILLAAVASAVLFVLTARLMVWAGALFASL